MNRPKIEDYLEDNYGHGDFTLNKDKHIEYLEKYCDQLECNLNVLVNKLKECADVSRLLEKRLDKALNKILYHRKSNYRYTCSIDSAYGYYHKEPTFEEIKNEIMKEVQ